MYSISFLYKIFVITELMLPIISELDSPKLYQMVLKENKNQSFHEYLSTELKLFEKHLKIDDYYYIIHNLEHRRIPAPFEKYDYKAYENEITNYCENEYDTIEHFKRKYAIKVFENALFLLNNCMDEILTTDINDEKQNESLKKELIEALSWLPKIDDASYTDHLVRMATKINECLRNRYYEEEQNNPSFVSCLVIDYEESDSSENYANRLLGNINNTLSADQSKKFESCMQSFQRKMFDVFTRGDGNITLGSLYLAQAIIYHHNSSLDFIDMSKLYQNFTGLNEIHITQDDRKYCQEKINKMDLVTYTATKLYYTILPGLLEHNSHAFYIKRRNQIIVDLSNIDEDNIEYYNDMKKNNENINKELFESMIKRRAMKDEEYISYAMRMNIRGYLPLSSSLWTEETENADNREIQIMTKMELTEDLSNLEGTLSNEIENST